MITALRRMTPLACLALAHLALLAHGAMLGCGFEASPYTQVDDNMDNPNFYACHCRCGTPVTTTLRIAASFDDAEQTLRGDDTDGAGDLDLGVVLAGVRFTNVVIPPGATITAAALQFTADQGFAGNNTTFLNLDVYAEAADSAPAFGGNFANLTARPRTTASIGWVVPAWTTQQSGPAQRSPDMKNVIQEVVNRTGWKAGNALAIFLAGGGGRREAETYDDNPARAAYLEVQYTAGTDQSLNVCMPSYLNPNLKDVNDMQQPIPSDLALQNDCEGRVETTLSGMAEACGYPSQCACDAEAGSRQFNTTCNDPCAEVPLGPSCSNFDPVNGTTTATNATGDAPVCVASRNAASMAPAPMSAAVFGQVSQCAVAGPAMVEIGDERKDTRAEGVVEFTGAPCPGGQCAVGLAYLLTLDPITFQVRFAADPVFEDLASSGASMMAAATVGPSGLGKVDAGMTESSIRGRRSSDSKAFILSNPDEIGVFVDWTRHTCALFGDLAGTADGETGSGDEALKAEVSVTGDILNEPPHADAGPDQTIECTSPAGAPATLDGRGSSDPENNLALLAWTRNSRVGPPVGAGAVQLLAQGIGGPVTYVVRAVDEFGQTDEDDTKVAVLDRGAPTLSLTVAPTLLLKLSPQLVTIRATLATTDTCDAQPAIRLVSIATNEGGLADGNGHSSPDIQGAAFGTDDREFQVRATRLPGSKGRLYTITYEVADQSGNKTTRTATVAAPRIGALPYNPPVRR